MAKDKPNKIATKKHLARLERERRQIQLITAIAIGIVVIIVGLIGYGILNETVLKPLRPVITVNNDKVSMHEFQVRVRITRQQYIDQYMQYYQFAQMFGVDTSGTSSIAQTMTQLSSSLDTPNVIGTQVLQDITNDLLIRQYAKANGITVTAGELDKAISDAFGYFPEGTPTATVTVTPPVFPTLSATQYALVTATVPPTAVPTGTPAPTQTPDLTATVTAIPSVTPTSTPYTLAGYQGRYKDALAYYAKLGMSEADFRKIYFESNLYRKRVSDIVTANVSHDQDQVWVRQILVADEATAADIRVQLLAGADFGTLASLNSLDTATKTTGGDLGWNGKGKLQTELETAAYALKIGEFSQPIQTTTGWYIIQVIDHAVRPLTETDYNTAVSDAMNTWLSDQRSSANIVIASAWAANVPSSPSLSDAFNSLYETATAYANQAPVQPTPTP